jgi:hypothetical protein
VRLAAPALVLLGVLAGVAAAQDGPAQAPTRTLAAGERYKSGAVHRFFLGSGYRGLWTQPITVEVLDLATFSGGLVAEKKGGGKQTKNLKLEGKDGREWKFRSIDKDPTTVLPKLLQETFAARIVQDQISASHPAGVLVADALADSAGIPHVGHIVVVLPDDPRLGEFRKEFAGMLGTLEEHPRVKPPVTPGFESFDGIVDTDELDELLDADARTRVDSQSLLRARLFDLVVGDTDRHRDQWHWAHDTKTGGYVAVPSDRDLAFVKFDGLFLKLARQESPQLADFEERYPGILSLAWQARRVDRRYLSDLDWPAWQPIVESLQASLTDAAIDASVRRLPEPYYRLDGATMAGRLKARRDRLPEAARNLYELLAREVEVHGSDEPDSARITRQEDGSVEVVLTGASGPFFRRRFLPGETDEVRVFLKGGDDRALSEGNGSARVTVRLVGGDGNDLLDDTAGHTRFYDTSGDNRVTKGPGTLTSHRPYTQPTDDDGNPARDWGSQSGIRPWVRANEDYGLVLGGAWELTKFGFRKHPYGARHTVRAGYSTTIGTGGVEYEFDSLRTDSRSRFHATARVSALELIHYYGFGNETSDAAEQGVYDVKQTQYRLAPSYRFDLATLDVAIGPVLKYADTHDSPATLLSLDQPYGAGRFGQLGARLGVRIDRRSLRAGRMTGALLSVEGTVYPAVWSVSETFGSLRAEGVSYVRTPLPLEPTLALRAGGAKLFGRYPFHEAATMGGGENFRGLPRQRYWGDASAYGNAELRLLLVRRERAVVPRFGVFGLADVGRVFLEGESSDRWHTAWGGGVWIAVADPKNLASVAIAASEGHLRFYVQGGFTF